MSLLSLAVAQAALADCPPPSHDRAALDALKAGQFAIADAADRQRLALDLVDCLAAPDPTLRDGIAFEAYAHWLRGDQLDAATRAELLARLEALVAGPDDAGGFRRPFAALVLAEVARTDRIARWLDDERLAALVERAARYVEGVRDYRGYDPREGWRHGVAHGADLLLQLALNERLSRAQLDRLLQAVASQVVPATPHAYVFGEPERLARPLLFVARRGLHTSADWDAWLQGVVARASAVDGAATYASSTGLTQRHDLSAFMNAAYVGAREGGEEAHAALLPALQAAVKRLP